jgi:hypothetical protein
MSAHFKARAIWSKGATPPRNSPNGASLWLLDPSNTFVASAISAGRRSRLSYRREFAAA